MDSAQLFLNVLFNSKILRYEGFLFMQFGYTVLLLLFCKLAYLQLLNIFEQP